MNTTTKNTTESDEIEIEIPPKKILGAPIAIAESVDLAGDAYRTLLEMIQLGRIPTDTPLQERTLAATLGISRTPLREAMSRLIGGGFAIRASRGQLVIKEPTLREYLEILQMRMVLEGEAAAMAAKRMETGRAQVLIAEIQAHLLAHNTSKEENHRIDNLLHDSIASASGNQMLAQTIHDLRIKARCFDQNGAPDRFAPSCREHIAILQAIAEHREEEARAAMQMHLDNARRGLVARHTNL